MFLGAAMLGKQVWEELVLAEVDVGLVGVACVEKVALRRLEGKCGHHMSFRSR